MRRIAHVKKCVELLVLNTQFSLIMNRLQYNYVSSVTSWLVSNKVCLFRLQKYLYQYLHIDLSRHIPNYSDSMIVYLPIFSYIRLKFMLFDDQIQFCWLEATTQAIAGIKVLADLWPATSLDHLGWAKIRDSS